MIQTPSESLPCSPDPCAVNSRESDSRGDFNPTHDPRRRGNGRRGNASGEVVVTQRCHVDHFILVTRRPA
jgi:hypothetical protein